MRNITYYNAGAGSGKTHKLTTLLVEKINGGINPSEVILTTFTELAAAEFKEKAREALLKKLPDKATELDSGVIGTVHSVTLNMIKKYWYLLGISPQVNVMSEADKKFYISQSMMTIATPGQSAFFNDFYQNFKLEELDLDFWLGNVEQIVNDIVNYQIDDKGLEESETESKKSVDAIFFSKVIPDEKTIREIFKQAMALADRDAADNGTAERALAALKEISRKNPLYYDTLLSLYKLGMHGGMRLAEEL